MRKLWKRLAMAAMSGLLLVVPVVVRADDDDDHDVARELYEHGEIHALSDIMRVVGDRIAGDIVAVDLVAEGQRWVYRFQVVTPDGRRVFVDVDAGAGTVRKGEDD